MALHGDDRPVLNAANLGPGLVAMRQALNPINLQHASRSSQYNPFPLFLIDSATLSCQTPGNYIHMQLFAMAVTRCIAAYSGRKRKTKQELSSGHT